MAKVLLVEDDNNLREIYQARLLAEGYDIVTAQNGEEALVVAKQNKPDLIISDVMMPRISGFEMLDILRNTNELKNTKVIMLTALGQDDDQKRAGNLGANRYLVKSQVTLEDIVNAAKELLSEDGVIAPEPTTTSPTESSMVAPAAPGIPAIAHVPDPTQPQLTPTVAQTPVVAAPPAEPAPVVATPPQQVQAPQPSTPVVTPPKPTTPAMPAPISVPTPAPTPTASAPVEPPVTPAPVTTAPMPAPASMPTPVEQPVAVAPEPVTPSVPTPAPTPTASADMGAQNLEAEEAALQAQIASYAQSSESTAPAGPPPTDDKAATAASNDQTIADAVKQLDSSSAPAPAAAPATPVEPPVTPAPVTTAPAPTEPAAATPGTSSSDSVSVSGKKIIQPISDPSAKPDLNALLAKEEAANPTNPAPVANTPPPASAPATPSTGTTPPGPAFDPSTSL